MRRPVRIALTLLLTGLAIAYLVWKIDLHETVDTIVERLVAFSEAERFYTYAILEAPFPVTGYLSTLRVHAIPGRDDVAEVQWSGRFTPDGVSEADAEALFAGIYRDGLAALRQSLAA